MRIGLLLLGVAIMFLVGYYGGWHDSKRHHIRKLGNTEDTQ